MRRKVGLLALLLCLCATAAGGVELDTVLQRLKQSAGSVQTIRSRFVQEKRLAMFSEVLVSRGRFAFARPGRLRWEYVEPLAMGFVIDGERGRRWNSLAQQDRSFDLEDSLEMRIAAEQLLIWTELDLDKLRRAYTIAVDRPEPVALLLTPKGLAARQFVDHLRVSFSSSGRTVTEVVIYEAGGDETRLRFDHTEVDRPLDAALFQL